MAGHRTDTLVSRTVFAINVDAGSLEEDSTHYTNTGTGCFRNHEHGFKGPNSGNGGEDNRTFQMTGVGTGGDMAPGAVNPSANNRLDGPLQPMEELHPIASQVGQKETQ